MRADLKMSVFLLLFIVSCSSSQWGWKPENESGDRGARKQNMVEDFDPLSLNDDDIIVTPAAVNKSKEEQRGEETIPTEVEMKQREVVNGYRVQLIAVKDEDAARKVQEKAIYLFEEEVYLIFDTPNYKVQVGDCKTEEEANELVQRARSLGFSDAWKVPAKVYTKPVKKMKL